MSETATSCSLDMTWIDGVPRFLLSNILGGFILTKQNKDKKTRLFLKFINGTILPKKGQILIDRNAHRSNGGKVKKCKIVMIWLIIYFIRLGRRPLNDEKLHKKERNINNISKNNKKTKQQQQQQE